MNSEKRLSLKIAEIEESIQNKNDDIFNRTLIRNFGEVSIPNGEFRLQTKFFCERSSTTELDLYLNVGAEKACEVSLIVDGAILSRMCSSIKYFDRARRNFFCGAGEHTLEICFVNSDSEFTLSAVAVLTGCLRKDDSPSVAFCQSGAESVFAVADDDVIRVYNEYFAETKILETKSDRIALADINGLRLFYLTAGEIKCKSVFAQSLAETVAVGVTDFCFVANSSGGVVFFIKEKKLFSASVVFFDDELSVGEQTAIETSYTDKLSKVRVVKDQEGAFVFITQGQSGIYVGDKRLQLKGLSDALFGSDGKIKIMTVENGLSCIVEADSIDFSAGEKSEKCFCDAACFVNENCLFVVRDKKTERENI